MQDNEILLGSVNIGGRQHLIISEELVKLESTWDSTPPKLEVPQVFLSLPAAVVWKRSLMPVLEGRTRPCRSR